MGRSFLWLLLSIAGCGGLVDDSQVAVQSAGGGAGGFAELSSTGGFSSGGASIAGQSSGGMSEYSTGGAPTGGQPAGGFSSGGGSIGGFATGGMSTGGHSTGGAPIGATGGYSSGGASIGGQSSGGSGGGIQAYFDGKTLDVRISSSIVTPNGREVPSLDLLVMNNNSDASGGWSRTIGLSTDPLPARMWVGLDGSTFVSLDPCTASAIDPDRGEVRILVPVEYLGDEPFVVRYQPGLITGGWSATAQRVQQLPEFTGQTMDCSKGFEFETGSERFTQLLSFVGLNVATRGCGLTLEGQIRCWDIPNCIETYSVPPGPFEQLGILGYLQVCGLRAGGALDCFKIAGDLGGYRVPPTPTGNFRRISEYGNCGIRDDGKVSCWPQENNDASQLIEGDFVEVAGSSLLGCAVDRAGALKCWQVQGPEDPPIYFERLDDRYRDVAVGSGVICALTLDGNVDCITTWGYYVDRKVRLAGGPFQWIGGPWALCALDVNGHATCIGSIDAVPPGSFTSLAVGEWTDPPCGLLLDGHLSCWNAPDFRIP